MLNITAISAEYQKTLQLDVSDADRLAFECKGYSLAFQIFGYVYWKALCKYDHIEEIDPNEVDSEIDSILADLAYDKIYEELSNKDVQVLKALVAAVRNGDSGNVKNEDVRTAINMSSETFATYRKRLIDRGIVDGRQFGYLRLRLPRLENYVKLR